MTNRIFLVSLTLVSGFLIVGCGPKQTSLSTAPQQEQVIFGGSYDRLDTPQKELIDEWFQNVGLMLETTLDPVEEYDQMPLSTRTTFEAVTHSLMKTDLHDANGNSLGSAIDMIEDLETIRGHIPHVRGDLQFRIYVTLKPGTKEILDKSVEFKRGHDNTIYHHGFPYSYRLDGTPSTQLSVTEDFERADIDVDYRSSSFPLVLFNGHLTAANSDVRIGNNYQTHLERWDGLPDWWRDFLTLIEGTFRGEASSDGEYFIPPEPSISKDAPITEALDDYLTTWLIDKDPEGAAAYHSGSAITCFDPTTEEEDELSLARYKIVARMAHIGELTGDISDLDGTVSALEPSNPAFIPVEHLDQDNFTLVHVPREFASVLTCGALNHPEDAHLLPVGDYYGAFFEIKETDNQLVDIFQLWGKDEDYWKVLSYHVALESREEIYDLIPDRFEIPASTLEKIEGEPEFLRQVEQLFQSWITKGDFEEVMNYFGESSLHCPRHYDFKGKPDQISPEEAREIILEKLRILRKGIPAGDELSESIRRVEPWNSSLKLIAHDHEDAYTLVSVPDGFAEPLLCENRDRAHEIARSADHGTYHASLFQMNVRSDHPAVVIFLWTEYEGKNWKIVSYHLETH